MEYIRGKTKSGKLPGANWKFIGTRLYQDGEKDDRAAKDSMKITNRCRPNFQLLQSRQRVPLINTKVVSLCLGFILAMAGGGQAAPPSGDIQEITGHLYPGEREVYDLPNLKQGDRLYVYMQHLSGNLDPLFAIADSEFDLKLFDARLNSLLQEEPENPFGAFRDLLDDFYLAWDDDSGKGSDAALQFAVPADGDYKIVVAGSRQPAGRKVIGQTFGDYRLIIGLNAPQVLTGQAASTGAMLTRLQEAPSARPRIQEVTGTLTSENNTTYYRLDNLDAGSTLYVRLETTAGDFKPMLSLKNYANKVLRVDNILGTRETAHLQYYFKENVRNFSLHISGNFANNPTTSGSYRLRIGINAPEVLKGEGTPGGSPIILEPIKVRVGLQMDQITEVNQRGENFGVVATLQMRWLDPDFAFNPDSCECDRLLFARSAFDRFLNQNRLEWPHFLLYNQQGNRWFQDQFFAIYPQGEVSYFERFSATLQAPDFNFRRFPFDTQQFFIRLISVFPEEKYVFANLPELTRVGQQLGEEEWYIIKYDTKVTSFAMGGHQYSHFVFGFLAQRHLSYYIFRIFIPLFLIITVSWVSFFLKDYAKRVDISGANLLVFIAFNFTFGSDLPRLGYLTFLDSILIVAFIVTALTVICNVALKRLNTLGNHDFIEAIDTYILWGYPIFYGVGLLILIFIFFSVLSGGVAHIYIDFFE